MRNNQFSTFFFLAMMFLIFFGSIRFLFPMIIMYFIVRAVMSGQEQQHRDPWGRNQRRRDNRRSRDDRYQRRETEYERRRRERETARRRQPPPPPKPKRHRPRRNPFKESGIKKFKEYDYDGAIEDFTKALELDGSDVAVHFNIACCYSLNEDKDKAFYHLSKAVALGFKDFQKIEEHDALAYLRIQEEFEDFKKNGYRIVQAKNSSAAPKEHSSMLLEQLQKLQELRERGVLTEEEFVIQKEKLLR